MTKIFLIHGLEPNTDKDIEIKNELVLFPGGGGGHLGIFWMGMCRPGHQIGTPL